MSRSLNLFIAIALFLSSFAAQAQKRGVPPSAVSPGRSATHSTAPASSAPAIAVAPKPPVPAMAGSNAAPADNAATPAASAGNTNGPPATAAPKAAPDVPENATVITLHGLCSNADGSAELPKDPKTCALTISRDQFEDVVSAVSLGGQVFTSGAIRNVADTYVQNLILADAALKTGVDKDPRVQKLLELVRNRTLAEAYRHAAEEKYRTPSAEEIEKYYRANITQYEAVKTERIFIPKFNPRSPKDNGDFLKKAEAVANEMRDRAGKGESADKLQSEGVMKLGIPAPAFLPENGLRRRASFPSDVVRDVFALKPGEVTKIQNEAGGFAIYRLITKDTWTVDQVRGEIVRDIFRQKMEADVKGVLQSVQADMNQQYFAPAVTAQPAALPAPIPGKNSKSGPAGARVQSTHSFKLPPVAPESAPASGTAK
jgi:PPIC-type PPIASE domain